MQQRIYVPLDKTEITALFKMAGSQCRRPHEQIRFIVRKALQLGGYLDQGEYPKSVDEGEDEGS